MKYSTHLPEGWEKAIGAELDKRLEEFISNGGKVLQVKEKFGGLRVYVQGQIDIGDLEEKCSNACMNCGEPGTMTTTRGWIGPRCEEHAKG